MRLVSSSELQLLKLSFLVRFVDGGTFSEICSHSFSDSKRFSSFISSNSIFISGDLFPSDFRRSSLLPINPLSRLCCFLDCTKFDGSKNSGCGVLRSSSSDTSLSTLFSMTSGIFLMESSWSVATFLDFFFLFTVSYWLSVFSEAINVSSLESVSDDLSDSFGSTEFCCSESANKLSNEELCDLPAPLALTSFFLLCSGDGLPSLSLPTLPLPSDSFLSAVNPINPVKKYFSSLDEANSSSADFGSSAAQFNESNPSLQTSLLSDNVSSRSSSLLLLLLLPVFEFIWAFCAKPPKPKKKYFSNSEAETRFCFLLALTDSTSDSSQLSSTIVCNVKSIEALLYPRSSSSRSFAELDNENSSPESMSDSVAVVVANSSSPWLWSSTHESSSANPSSNNTTADKVSAPVITCTSSLFLFSLFTTDFSSSLNLFLFIKSS